MFNMKRGLAILLTVSLMVSGNMSTIAFAQEVLSTENRITTSEFIGDVEDTKTATVKEIATEQDLKNIANDIYGNYRLKNDIKLSSAEWTSIPKFYGTLDGNGHTISNLKSTKGQGLFIALAVTGKIMNLTIEANITTQDNAAVLGLYNDGTIENCIVKGNIKKLSQDDSDIWEGISGIVLENYGKIINCVNEATISAEHGVIGGITENNLGLIDNCINKGTLTTNDGSVGGITDINNHIILNSTNKGSIYNKRIFDWKSESAGGIAQSSVGIIYNCINEGNVTSYSDAYSVEAGGIVAHLGGESFKGAILSCVNRGKVQACGVAAGICARMNGVASGYEDLRYTEYGRVLIADCINDGEVVATRAEENPAVCASGIVVYAFSECHILRCTNNGNILGNGSGATATGVLGHSSLYIGDFPEEEQPFGYTLIVEDCINNGFIKGVEARGLIGYIEAYKKTPATVRRCVNNGNVESKERDLTGIAYTVAQNAVGIIGTAIYVNVEECANYGDIKGTVASGIGGRIDYSHIKNCLNQGTVTAEYAIGMATESIQSTFELCCNTGTSVGTKMQTAMLTTDTSWLVTPNINNCYYTDSMSIDENGHGIFVKSEDVGKINTYAGFDFANIWTMKNVNGTYTPVLQCNVPTKKSVALKNENIRVEYGGSAKVEASSGELFFVKAGSVNGAVGLYDYTVSTGSPAKYTYYAVFSDGQLKTGNISVWRDISDAWIGWNSMTNEVKYTYDGTAKTPGVIVNLDGYVMEEGTIHTVTYKNNINAGKATAIVTGVNGYEGTVELTFTIEPISMKDAKVSLSTTSYTYNGKAKKPSVTIMLGDKKLVKDKDYTVSYKNNNNIGTATVTIKGKGNYTGTVTKTFTIKAKKGATFTSGSYKYKVTSSSAVAFTGFAKKETLKVTIPKTVKYGGKTFKVTAVASKAFKGKTKVTQVTIGDNVTSIGSSAFAGCTKLSKVTIGKNVKTIGASAFEGCKKLSKVTFGSAVTTIGVKAFKGCTALKSITIPSKVTKIDKQAFYGCKNLKTITIKATKLKTVGKKSLKGIYAKATIKVPKSKLSAYKTLLKKGGLSSKAKIVKY